MVVRVANENKAFFSLDRNTPRRVKLARIRAKFAEGLEQRARCSEYVHTVLPCVHYDQVALLIH